MKKKPVNTHAVAAHYDAVASGYHEQYDREKLLSLPFYPANYFRLQHLLNSFVQKGLRKVVEVGVGEGTPLVELGRGGMEVWGFDVSPEMVKRAKQNMRSAKFDPHRIFWGDIQDPATYVHALRGGLFDGLLAMGVMPHVENDVMVLKNMAACVREGGSLFVEFRNKLFSLFTFNRLTVEFILDDLLRGVSPELKDLVRKDLSSRLNMDAPRVRDSVSGTDAPGYDLIPAKFHNPFEVKELFTSLGFRDIRFIWYHYHPVMPSLEAKAGSLFRREAFRLEHESSEWRGMFLCSAFVVEAVK